MGQPQRNGINIDDYVAIELEDDMHYEYHEGRLYAMAGGSIPQSTICNNIENLLFNVARKKGTR